MEQYNVLSGLSQTDVYIQRAYGNIQNRILQAGTDSFQTILQTAGYASGQSTASISTPMDDIFEEAARTYGVDVNLLKAIGKAESNFNADAVSPAGAIGVMQLMPATAASLGVTDPYDARQNIMGGAKYIADMVGRYDGNAELALAAYNAGSGNVERYGGIPPFAETQNYVKKVLGYMGQNLDSGTYIQQAASTSRQTPQSSTYRSDASGFDSKMQQYYVEMWKQQMSMRLCSVVSEL